MDRWSGIIHCAALDATPTHAITAASLSAIPCQHTQPARAVRSLDAEAWSGAPRLWIITRGATAVQDADRAGLAIAQAPLIGLARVIQAEHPTRFAAWIDIDPSAAPVEQAAAVARPNWRATVTSRPWPGVAADGTSNVSPHSPRRPRSGRSPSGPTRAT